MLAVLVLLTSTVYGEVAAVATSIAADEVHVETVLAYAVGAAVLRIRRVPGAWHVEWQRSGFAVSGLVSLVQARAFVLGERAFVRLHVQRLRAAMDAA